MTKKTVKSRRILSGEFAMYGLVFCAILAFVFFGSANKTAKKDSSLDMNSIYANNFKVSADQISEFKVVSELASSMRLASSDIINNNYTTVAIMQDVGQTTLAEKLEKPDIVDTSHLSRGIITHTVSDGENMDTIAAKYGVTATQIRWSNSLKNTNLSTGQQLLIPNISGIIYKVKDGDTVASLAQKYKSDADKILSLNDLETSEGLTVGATIILPSGELPETERPEYVAPRRNTGGGGGWGGRTYWTASNPMAYGWCTYYAWGRRSAMGGAYVLPGGIGNANTWDNSLYGIFRIDGTPRPGAVFQTDAGGYGHVGIVDSVNADGTITVSDMNGIAGWGRVGTATWDSATWSKYKYIHERL